LKATFVNLVRLGRATLTPLRRYAAKDGEMTLAE
jgi:hypothetical protein